MLKIVEVCICIMFACSIVALIAGRFLSIGTEADEMIAKMLKGQE